MAQATPSQLHFAFALAPPRQNFRFLEPATGSGMRVQELGGKKDLPNCKNYVKKSLRYDRRVCYNCYIGAAAPKFFSGTSVFLSDKKKSAWHFLCEADFLECVF